MQNVNHITECDWYAGCESYVNANHMSECDSYAGCESYVNVDHMSMWIICQCESVSEWEFYVRM